MIFPAIIVPLSVSQAEDATIQAPGSGKEIPIEQGTPAARPETPTVHKELGEEPGRDVANPVRRVIWQLRDYNWEQNVNLRVRKFTLLGNRDATSNDRMLFRFLTQEEHAQKMVMNSKASLIGTPPMHTSAKPRASAPRTTP